MNVSIFNGAGQSDYLYGLVSGLIETPIIKIDILDINKAAYLFKSFDKVDFHTVFWYQKPGSSFFKKGKNILAFYILQSKFLISKKPRIVHFQWLDRYFLTDRIMLPILARLRGHKVVLTVHNVNAGKRDKNDTYYNRFTLYMLYHLCNHLIVHTIKSKQELEKEFNVKPANISVIKHGMNNKVTNGGISSIAARNSMLINSHEKVILFFGNLDYYKGVDILIEGINYLPVELRNQIRLIIAGNSKSREYLNEIHSMIERSSFNFKTIAHLKYINDEDIEKYFMAADCIVLPYRDIYQSGVLFMAYNFGLPTLATKVGNFENDIIENKTGYLIDSTTPESVAITINKYFQSTMYSNLKETRKNIKKWAGNNYSWKSIGNKTHDVYKCIFNERKG